MKRRRKRGFTLIEMMISSMLFAVIAIGVTTYILYMTRFQHAQTFRKAVDDILLNIAQNVQDDRAWTNTVAHASNTSLACLKDRGDVADASNNGCIDEVNATDTAAEEGAQTILLMNGQTTPATPTVFYDPKDKLGLVTDPALPGFSLNGKSCNTFVDPAVNDQCPLWANIYWEPVCDSSIANGCRYPLIRVKTIMKFKPFTSERNYAFSEERARAIIYRNTVETSNFLSVGRINGIRAGFESDFRLICGLFWAIRRGGYSWAWVLGALELRSQVTERVWGEAVPEAGPT